MTAVSRFPRKWWAILTVAVLLALRTSAASEPLQIDWSSLRDVAGQEVGTLDGHWKVVCFLGAECPLARLYGPRLNALASDFRDRQVRFVGINSNPQDSPGKIAKYVRECGVAFPVIKDADQSFADAFEAKRTPEVFVVDPEGRVGYRGRIDDQYVPGQARADATRHDLRDALTALLAGRPAPEPVTEATGCLITRLKRSLLPDATLPKVTFTRDIALVLNRHCVECHRPGEIGPFSLTDYHEVRGWGEMILEVIDQGRMPPWHADRQHGRFLGERFLPESDRELLVAWVRQGMPEGDPADLPPSPEWAGGWHLNQPPDEELAMRGRPFRVPAEGVVDYQYFVVDPGWTTERWIRAAQVIPGRPSVVHHTIVFVRPPDGADTRGIGWLGAYVPGQRPARLPAGHARRVPAGSKLVFQMHYTPNGQPQEDLTRIGVWFADPAEVTHEVFTRVALNHDFEIPPGAADHKVALRLSGFAPEARLLGATPHMHLRGKSFRLEAVRQGERETLLSVPHYDFNWQHWYQWEMPIDLKPVESLEMEIGFDNSRGNRVNPDANEFVTWGDQTWNEMAVAFLDVAQPRGSPREAHREQVETDENAAERNRRIAERVADFLKKMDHNGDGVVEKGETPLSFQRFGFRQLDTNGDGRLERGEIEAAAARR